MTEAALRTRPPPDGSARDWAASYAPPPGATDSFLDASGQPRAVWARFLDRLGSETPDGLGQRLAEAERHVRDTGLSYRVHGEGPERPWPVATLPLLLDAAEWRRLAADVVQRATLLEAVLWDLYGAGTLTAAGIVPAALVAGCPDFLRPLHGVMPPGGRFLHLYAADLVQGPDGWQVIADRTQAPSGAGYALENRLILSRALPGLYEAMGVERLAPFFQDFRAGLAGAAERSDPRLCLLTPGPLSETYFEQATLARYLGLMLVEGDDLLVRDGHVHVRTVSGLKRADAIWRRVDGDFMDPLELNPSSRLGVAGLVEVLRDGGVVVGNMPGSGVVEAGGLVPFLPGAARHLLGEELRLGSVPSWWGGDPAGLAAIEAADGALSFASAYAPAGAPAGESDPWRQRLAERPGNVVARAAVPLCTAPSLEDGRLVPRPYTLRVLAAATADGWTVMPGGFARIGHDERVPLAITAGTRSADVWIASDGPVPPVTLLPRPDRVRVRRVAGHLPSRAADDLFWFGRYLERAEGVVRLVRALLDARDTGADEAETCGRVAALLVRWGCLDADGTRDGTGASSDLAALARRALFAGRPKVSAYTHVTAARVAASNLRERLSAETWRALTEAVRALDGAEPAGEAALRDSVSAALSALSTLAGLAGENMNRAAGWHFVDMGRRIERAINTAETARALAHDGASAADLSALLDVLDSQITFGSRYILGASLAPVRDMALLDPFNPRSVAFQLASLDRHLAELTGPQPDGLPERHVRTCRKLASDVAAADAAEIDERFTLDLEDRLEDLADAISVRFFPGGPNAARPEKLTGLA